MQLGMEDTDRFFTGEAGAGSFLSILSKEHRRERDHTALPVCSQHPDTNPARAFTVTQHG